MKKISVVIPTFNEEKNVQYAYERVRSVLMKMADRYRFEILFIDNYSKDKTRQLITKLCNEDGHVKAIFNMRNFGFSRSTFYGLTQADGDCVVLLFCDMQDPPELIPRFVEEWEKGYRLVAGIKTESKESRLLYFLRSIYYKFIKYTSDIEHISHFTGFGLYDASFVQVLRNLNDSLPYLRGIVAELGPERKDIFYEQETRKFGKSHFNFFKLYDLAMLGITSYSTVVMRLATIAGFLSSLGLLLVAVVTLIIKLLNWNYFSYGAAASTIGVYFIGSVQLFFIGFLGEYLLNINVRVMNRPLVIEEKRINFDKQGEQREAVMKEKAE